MEKHLTHLTQLGRGRYKVTMGGRQSIVYIAGPRHAPTVIFNGQVYEPRLTGAGGGGYARGHDLLEAPMPATVVQVLVAPGQPVAAGETLLTLEAMKMQLAVRAPKAGIVEAVYCQVGDLVQPGLTLIDIM